MDVTIIGSGTGIPSVRRASPCVLIETPALKILCDTGPGSLRKLMETGVTLNDIDIIFYSHLHIDHTADLAPFLFACKYAPGSFRTQDVTIIGHYGIKEFYQGLVDVYGTWIIPEHFSINWIETERDTFNFKNICIQTIPANHIESSIATRFDDGQGKSAVYSGDTDYCPEIAEIARMADLLIIECSFPDDQKCPGHLTPSLVGKIAREADCKKLVLTHLYPPCDSRDIVTPVSKLFSGEVVKAEDLMKIHV
jgi:ribonuclease BN (tRNA processing enzyme)